MPLPEVCDTWQSDRDGAHLHTRAPDPSTLDSCAPEPTTASLPDACETPPVPQSTRSRRSALNTRPTCIDPPSSRHQRGASPTPHAELRTHATKLRSHILEQSQLDQRRGKLEQAILSEVARLEAAADKHALHQQELAGARRAAEEARKVCARVCVCGAAVLQPCAVDALLSDRAEVWACVRKGWALPGSAGGS